MVNINFVPDDYVQNNESRKTNLIYLVLFAVVMALLAGAFITIKIRQQAVNRQEQLVNSKLDKAKKIIQQFEKLQKERKSMMKSALTTAQLLEPVPRSLLLASLTNNLPSGTSLLKLELIQKKANITKRNIRRSKYEKTQNKNDDEIDNPEKMLETHISIEGLAPSNRQVANYIKSLNNAVLFDNVALVESTEHKVQDTTFGKFKLRATLTKNIHLTKEDIERIKAKGKKATKVF